MSYEKYYKYKKQVSYDQGETWQDTGEYVPSGDPIGYYDTLEECMTVYRTIQSGYTCVGYDKHNQDVYEVSYDNGVTWSVVSTSAGTLIEADSPDCGYVPPTSAKFVLTLNDSSTVSAECDSTSAVTSGEVSTQYSGTVVSAEIGDCVNTIGSRAFYKCSGLTSVTIPSSVTSIGGDAFYSCSSLTSVTIPNSVTSIGSWAFYNCSGLTSIDIPSGVTSIGSGTFWGCTSLTSIDIPSGVTSIGVDAFYYCTSLTSITVNATTPPTLVGGALDDTNNCPIYVPCASVDAYKSATNWSTYASRIQGIPPCGQPTFEGKYKLTLSNSSTVSAECDSTSAITRNETSAYTNSVVNVQIGECVTTIGGDAFTRCRSLTSVTIPNSVTTIGSEAFSYCSGLTTVDIPNSVTTIGMDAFFKCSGLTSCTIGSGVTNIGSGAFYYCSGLTSVTIPDSVTSIDYGAFYRCGGLTSCTIGSGVTSIGQQAFYYCTGLTSVTVNATTPPTLNIEVFYGTTCPIYVPSASVNAYKSASRWIDYASRIQAIP